MRATRIAALLLTISAWPSVAEETVFLARHGKDRGNLVYEGGAWKLGKRRLSSRELLLARFTKPFHSHPVTGVFLRDGSFVCGTLESLVGDKAVVHALTLNWKPTIKREDLAGALYSLPLGHEENIPSLAQPQALMTALRNLQRDPPFSERLAVDLQPGQRDHVFYKNRDSISGKLVRLTEEHALIDLPDGRLAAPHRRLLRLVEFRTAPLPPPSDKQRAEGQAVVVHLKPGDVLMGRIAKLDAKEMVLKTVCAGEVRVPRTALDAIYPTGERGSGWTWLSSLRPSRAEHTPVFDASFPPRTNASCCGHPMKIAGIPCPLGIGVHSKTSLTYDLKSRRARHFVALVGLDDESRGRGDAVARILLDDREVWHSGPLQPGAAPRHVAVELGKSKKLTLLVDYGPDGDDTGDHVNWAWAALVGP